MTTPVQFHPVADIFPMMSDREFADLVADIREHGVREPVWLYGDGRIIDGRNRYKACAQLGIEPWWDVVYRRAFPDLLSTADLRHDGWHQRAGRDRAIVLSSGRTIYVDEKVRERDYDDVLLEVWSRYPKSGEPPYPAKREGFDVAGTAAGWARKPLDCDWLAYAFEQSQICYLLPFLGIRAALENQKLGWTQKATARADGFRWVEAQNANYKTISVAVPIDVLRAAINNALTISWGGA